MEKSAGGKLPQTLSTQFPIDGNGQMPLFGVVQWVATKGGSVHDFEGDDSERWRDPIQEVLTSIRGDDLQVFGRNAADKPVHVNSIEFHGCRIAYPYADAPGPMLDGTASYLQLFDYIYPGDLPDTDHEDGLTSDFNLEWHSDFNDRLWHRGEVAFSHLIVAKRQVRNLWPTRKWLASPPPPLKWAAQAELQRRFDAGEMDESGRREADLIAKWYNETYQPEGRDVAAQTVRTYIIELHRALKGGPK